MPAMMLSTRISTRRFLRFAAGAAAATLLAACATQPIATGAAPDDGIAVDVNGPVKVALIAPIGSADPALQRIAADLVNAGQLAAADVTAAQIELAVYDDQGTFAGGQAAASQAVAEGAKIIVGPLLSTATAGAEPIARSAGVSMLTFSNNPTVAGPGVYLLGVTPGNSASALVGHARAQGLSRFGVLYVQGETDEVIRDSVVQAISAGGGQVVSTQSYPYSQQGVNDTVAAMSVTLQNAGADAVFLTERSTAGLVADGLRANGLGADRALLMGLQPWGQDGATLGRPSLQGAVYAAPDPSLVGGFQSRYAAAYGATPHELAVLAYDGVGAIGALIAEARANGGSPFSTARITQPQGFAGANGAFRFTANGLSQRNLAIVEVRGGVAVVVSRAARGFASLAN